MEYDEGLWTAVLALIGAVVPFLIQTLRKWTQTQEILRKSKIDDQILAALEVSVTNVNNTLRTKFEAAKADGILTDEEKVELRKAALDEAKSQLSARGVDLYKEMSDEALNSLIRYIVDLLNKNKEQPANDGVEE